MKPNPNAKKLDKQRKPPVSCPRTIVETQVGTTAEIEVARQIRAYRAKERQRRKKIKAAIAAGLLMLTGSCRDPWASHDASPDWHGVNPYLPNTNAYVAPFATPPIPQ